jgi:DeoR family suf operon transcriptional repressor
MNDTNSYPTETMIILSLKRKKGLSLEELSRELRISKMGVLKHIQVLETRGIVRREISKKNIGRPYYRFYLVSNKGEILGNSSEKMLESFLEFANKEGYRDFVLKFLRNRYSEVEKFYKNALTSLTESQKVEKLAQLRQIENYFPELKKKGNDTFELLEFNCPIYRVANLFGEACSMERDLFKNVLDMDVESTHRQVNGFGTCRFLIRKHGNYP